MKNLKILTIILIFSFSFGFMISCTGDHDQNQLNILSSKNPDNLSPLPMQTISISVEGNGQKFPGLFGAFAAILERNLYPRVMAGGSSGANVAAPIMALLKNKSVIEAEVYDSTGRELSVAQKSSKVVSATIPIIDMFLFLPDFRNPIKKIMTILLAKYFEQNDFGYRADPTSSVIHIESLTGQVALLIGFFSEADFTEVILEEDINIRLKIMNKIWQDYANNFALTSDELLTALLFTPPSKDTERTREIKKRYFKLFRSIDTKEDNSPEICLEKYNKKLERNKILINLLPKQFIINKFNELLNKLDNVEMIGAGFPKPGKLFYLPDPDKLWDAFNGFSPTGNEIKFPESLIIQTTARTAIKKYDGSIQNKFGTDNFFQCYYLSENLREKFNKKFSDMNPTSYFTETGEKDQLFPNEKILVSYDVPVEQAIKASLSEPVFFRRDPIPHDDDTPMPTLEEDEVLLSYGGWLDIIPIGSLAMVGECENSDFIMNIGPMLPVSPFQRMGMQSVFLNALEDLLIKVDHESLMDEANTTEFAQFYKKVADLRSYIFELEGKIGKIHVDPGWDDPSRLTGELKKKMDVALANNRIGIMLLSYENTARYLNEIEELTSPKVEEISPSFGINVFQDFSKMESKEEIQNVIDSLFDKYYNTLQD